MGWPDVYGYVRVRYQNGSEWFEAIVPEASLSGLDKGRSIDDLLDILDEDIGPEFRLAVKWFLPDLASFDWKKDVLRQFWNRVRRYTRLLAVLDYIEERFDINIY